MPEKQWLTVKNWPEYQHYSDRLPPWVKLHMRLKTARSLNVCHPTARLLFLMLLLTAGEHDNVIPYKRAWLAQEVSLPVQAVTRHLPSLIQAGLLEVHASEPQGYVASKIASTAASAGASASRARREVEVEKEQVQKPAEQSRSKTTGETDKPRPARQAEGDSDTEHEDEWSIEPDPPAAINGSHPDLEPDDSMGTLAGELEAVKKRLG